MSDQRKGAHSFWGGGIGSPTGNDIINEDFFSETIRSDRNHGDDKIILSSSSVLV